MDPVGNVLVNSVKPYSTSDNYIYREVHNTHTRVVPVANQPMVNNAAVKVFFQEQSMDAVIMVINQIDWL